MVEYKRFWKWNWEGTNWFDWWILAKMDLYLVVTTHLIIPNIHFQSTILTLKINLTGTTPVNSTTPPRLYKYNITHVSHRYATL